MSDLQSKTDEELNRMLSEMLGWKLKTCAETRCGSPWIAPDGCKDSFPPGYCVSLDEVAKVEVGLDGFASDLYANILVNLLNPHRIDDYDPERDGAPTLAWPGVFQVVTATARQRTIALIETLTP